MSFSAHLTFINPLKPFY